MINDLALVRTFLAVVEAGSFTAAASGVYRSQAAVSQQIRRLESQVGAPLFARGHREVTLSETGRRFLPHARRLLHASEQARQAAQGIQPRTLRIGVADDLAAPIVMPALGALAASDDSLAFEVTTGYTSTLQALIPAQLDAVVGLAIPHLRRGTELARLRLQWFGHWNGHGSVPLALCGEGCLMRRQALAALDRVGLAWNLRVAASNVGVVEAAAAAGVAVGPLLEAIAPAGLAADEALPTPGAIGLRLYAGKHMDSRFVEQLATAIRHQLKARQQRHVAASASAGGKPKTLSAKARRSYAATPRPARAMR